MWSCGRAAEDKEHGAKHVVEDERKQKDNKENI